MSAQQVGEGKSEVPGGQEALAFLRAAASDPGVTIEEFDDIVGQMWNAGTLPNGLAHIYSLSDAEFLRDQLRDHKAEVAPLVVPSSSIPAPFTGDGGCEDDDEPSGYAPGMTPGPEDEEWNEALGSLTEPQIERLVDGLAGLFEKTKASQEAEEKVKTSRRRK